MADLPDFLAENGALTWEWGSVDAGMAVADWALANGHGDPLALYRGTYDDEAGWLAPVVKRGGVLPIVSDGCARAGLLAVGVLSVGAIGVIGSLTAPTRQWGAIWDGEHWLVRGADGFAPMSAPALGMWGV